MHRLDLMLWKFLHLSSMSMSRPTMTVHGSWRV